MSSSSRSSSIVSDINVSKRDRSEEHGHEGGEEVGVKAKKKVVRIQKLVPCFCFLGEGERAKRANDFDFFGRIEPV